MKHVIVLGAGPAGLGAAIELVDKGHKVTLVEKRKFVGGAGASQKIKGCIVDYGPHLFHPTTKEVTDLMKRFSKGKYFEAVMINKLLLRGKLFTYPFRLGEAVRKLSIFTNARIVLDYVVMKVQNIIRPKKIKSFEDWGKMSFGHTLYKLCFGTYTARVWGRDPKTISAKLAKEKLSALSLRKILMNFLLRRTQTDGYLNVRHYGYHEDGIGTIYENMASFIKKKGSDVLCDATVTKMQHTKGKVTSVTIQTLKGSKTIKPDAVISTIPIDALMSSLSPKPPKNVAFSNDALEYRDMLFTNYVITRDQFSDAHMTYLMDPKFISNRVSEMKNATPKASPKGQTLLTFEIPCNSTDDIWGASDKELFAYNKSDLDNLGIKQSEIVHAFTTKYIDAYPVFSIGYEKHLHVLKKYFSEYTNLLPTGRQSLYLNIDMHDSIRMGRVAANYAIQEKPKESWMQTIHTFIKGLKL